MTVPLAARYTDARALTVAGVLALLTVLLAVLALGLGAVATPAAEVWAALWGGSDDLTRQLVLDLRLPRVGVSLLCGAMFAASGAVMQGVIRNPLASPDIIGVGAGAGLAATVFLLAWPAAPAGGLPWAALAGAWGGFGLVLLLAQEWRGGSGLHPVRLALVGVAVAAALGAVQQLVLVRAPDGLGAALTFPDRHGLRRGFGASAAGVALGRWRCCLPRCCSSRTLDVLQSGRGPGDRPGHKGQSGPPALTRGGRGAGRGCRDRGRDSGLRGAAGPAPGPLAGRRKAWADAAGQYAAGGAPGAGRRYPGPRSLAAAGSSGRDFYHPGRCTVFPVLCSEGAHDPS